MMVTIMSLAIVLPNLSFDLIIAALCKYVFLFLNSTVFLRKRQEFFFSSVIFILPWLKMFSLYSEVRCAAAPSPVRLFLDIVLSRPAEFLPGALYDSRLVVEAKSWPSETWLCL